jgi:transcriptional regulator with PAS, ATPase and Fis domain
VSLSAIDGVTHLINEGRYLEALKKFDAPSSASIGDSRADVIRAELCERTGQLSQAKKLLESITKKRLTPSDLSVCYLVSGRISCEEGDPGSGVSKIQKAVGIASEASDLRNKCWAQVWLAVLVADRSGPSAAAPILSECRFDAIKLADSRFWAALHAFSAVIDGRRGLFNSALSHIRLGSELLAQAPNKWLEASLETTRTNIDILCCNYGSALIHGRRALELAELSGVAAILRTSLTGLGCVYHCQGEFDEAVRHFTRARAILPFNNEHQHGLLDSLAQTRLAQGSLDECSNLLSEIEQSVEAPNKVLYGNRYSLVTLCRVLARQGFHERALARIDEAIELSIRTNDNFLKITASLEKSHVLQQLDRVSESMQLLGQIVCAIPPESPELHAQYEMILACVLSKQGLREAARLHKQRSERILTGLRNRPALVNLAHYWDSSSLPDESTRANSPVIAQITPTTDDSIQCVATLLTHSSRPELVATALVELFALSASVESAIATIGKNNERIIANVGRVEIHSMECIYSGTVHGDPIQVLIKQKSDVQSVATVSAISKLLLTIQELERARAEREERLTLWPIEDVPLMHDHAVVNGKMREMVNTARKVATTNISVLLTGESGTGKEILARAIHTFSDRAAQPFVPFNCSAIPRDMLESQLFGHRRGAFTGADRDNPGLIRAAKGGTLFLDEVGELSPELQPKLLRFLESGEICPLGETAPFTVNVRIIAATNAKLEDAVKSGRFREDLFYRLNVVRLQLPPLRERRDELPSFVHRFVTKAAIEYRKGQIRIAENNMERLLLAEWPGNIRQLQNEIRRMIALADADAVLTPASLSADVAGTPDQAQTAQPGGFVPPANAKLNPTLATIEREMIRAALQQHHGKMDAAARALGISRKGLYLKRQRLGL